MKGGGRYIINLENKTIKIYDKNESIKKGRHIDYESFEIEIFQIIFKYDHLIDMLTKSSYLKNKYSGTQIFSVNRDFWFINGPLFDILTDLIDNGNQDDAYKIIVKLYEALLSRIKDNHKKFDESRSGRSSRKSKGSHASTSTSSPKNAERLFNEHHEQIRQLKKTLVKSIALARKNRNVTGSFRTWLDKAYQTNIDMMKDSGYGLKKKKIKTIKNLLKRKSRTIRKKTRNKKK